MFRLSPQRFGLYGTGRLHCANTLAGKLAYFLSLIEFLAFRHVGPGLPAILWTRKLLSQPELCYRRVERAHKEAIC